MAAGRRALVWLLASLTLAGGCAAPKPPLRHDPSRFRYPASLLQHPGGSASQLFLRDLRAAPGGLVDDTRSAFASPSRLLLLGLAAGAAGYLKNSPVDTFSDGFFARHDIMRKDASVFFDELGKGYLLFAGAAGWYAWSAWNDHPAGREASKTLLSALSITGLTTLALKGLDLNGTRPTGGPYGFPSGHSSMSMAAAATIQGLYGLDAGIPAFALAILVGIQRLDNLQHDFADVVFGWTLGYVIGSGVTENRLPRVLGARVVPFYDAESGAVGGALSWSF